MANYYYVKIEDKNVTQEMAVKTFNCLANDCEVRNFSFHEGYISYNTRGLTDIRDIIKEYGINEEEIDVADEFELMERALYNQG